MGPIERESEELSDRAALLCVYANIYEKTSEL